MRNETNAVDLAFVVDTTGSMGGLIAAAQSQMIGMLEEVTRTADINLWLGVVEYRDHPPQDTLLYKVYPLTEDLQKAQKAIRGLQANGGDELADRMQHTRHAVSASLVRLLSRDLIEVPVTP